MVEHLKVGFHGPQPGVMWTFWVALPVFQKPVNQHTCRTVSKSTGWSRKTYAIKILNFMIFFAVFQNALGMAQAGTDFFGGDGIFLQILDHPRFFAFSR